MTSIIPERKIWFGSNSDHWNSSNKHLAISFRVRVRDISINAFCSNHPVFLHRFSELTNSLTDAAFHAFRWYRYPGSPYIFSLWFVLPRSCSVRLNFLIAF
jgi:hypothetical protein